MFLIFFVQPLWPSSSPLREKNKELGTAQSRRHAGITAHTGRVDSAAAAAHLCPEPVTASVNDPAIERIADKEKYTHTRFSLI